MSKLIIISPLSTFFSGNYSWQHLYLSDSLNFLAVGGWLAIRVENDVVRLTVQYMPHSDEQLAGYSDEQLAGYSTSIFILFFLRTTIWWYEKRMKKQSGHHCHAPMGHLATDLRTDSLSGRTCTRRVPRLFFSSKKGRTNIHDFKSLTVRN